MDQKVKKSKYLKPCRINLHKGVKEKNLEAWQKLNELLLKIQKDDNLVTQNG
jgi:hypothetical protein